MSENSRKIRAIPGMAWAVDILLGNRPLPMRPHAGEKEKGGDGFKAVFDEKMEELRRKEQ